MNPFSSYRKEESGELPLASFLDIIFILLIFVLVSTQMVSEYILPVDLPDSSTGTTGKDENTLDLYLDEKGVRIPALKLETSLDDLRSRLQDRCASKPIFKIRAPAQLPLQRFVQLTDSLQDCGSLQLVVKK